MWAWVVGGLLVWVLVALAVALVLGGAVRLRDVRSDGPPPYAQASSSHTAAVDSRGRSVARGPRRRRIPLPPVGIGLAALAVGLMTVGYVLRLTGSTGATARLLSMDAPMSVPRLFVAALFAVAAVAALVGAGRIPGRRTWWSAVGVVAAGISVTKAGGAVHTEAMAAVEGVVGPAGALAVGAVAAVGVLAVLGFISRAERRDRRRVLSCLAGYGAAAVGLSAVSAAAVGQWTIAATYVEESAEALAGVAFLVAVLIGVAPRLVLPASWSVRRAADPHTLDAAPGTIAGPREAGGVVRG